MTKQLADAIKFLDRIIAPCPTGPSDHGWRSCPRCQAIARVQDQDALALTLLRAAVDELKRR